MYDIVQTTTAIKLAQVIECSRYLSLNVGGAKRLQQVMAKDFKPVDLETCKETDAAFKETFPVIVNYQRAVHRAAGKNQIDIKVELKSGSRYSQKYALYRTPDGRLIHLQCFENVRKNGETVFEPKISDVTSSLLVSPEALCEKQTMARQFEFLRTSNHGNVCKMIGFCHDEMVFHVEDSEEGRQAIHEMFKINSEEFTRALPGINSNMNGDLESAMKTLCDNYSEK